MIRIWSHQIYRCRSAEWDTVNFLLPIMTDIVLPHLYCRCPHCIAYLLLYLSSVALIIPHIFCYPRSLTSPPQLFCFCLSRPVSPPPYPLPSLYAICLVLHVCFLCTYQPDSPLHFSSAAVSTIPHICLRHPCYPISLPRLCCLCLYRPASLLLPSPSLRIYVAPFPPCISTHLCKVSNYPPPSL